MKTNLQNRIGGLAFLSALFLTLQPSSARAQGSLTPPGPPGPTMKTLQQVEPRTPIDSAPYTITQPGSYYLTTNLTVSSGDAIVIATNGVTLDLNGFTLRSTAPSAGGTAILISGGLSDIAIFNGHIRGGVTNNAGVYGGPGFGNGINYIGTAPGNVRVSGINVSGCLYDGIYLGSGDSTVVEGCTVRTVGGLGIGAGVVKGSVALVGGGYAIVGYSVTDCRGTATGSGYGIYASTALNCYGQSSSGYGIYASTAQNCYGRSSSGTGVSATTAGNCYGESSSGSGVYATTAENCYGYSSSGTGVSATTAQNCYGYSSTSGLAGLYAQNAAFCVGFRYDGRAIWATIANGCWAAAGTNFITYKYNMP